MAIFHSYVRNYTRGYIPTIQPFPNPKEHGPPSVLSVICLEKNGWAINSSRNSADLGGLQRPEKSKGTLDHHPK